MKTFYYKKLSTTRIAVLDIFQMSIDEVLEICEQDIEVDETEQFHLISRINVPREYRGQGIGTELLERVLEEADIEEVNLVLEILPFSDGPDYEVLHAWYSKHGFREMGPNGYFWRPHNPVEVEA